jgi:ribosomal protein S18 acetylase RimI-like enzyme
VQRVAVADAARGVGRALIACIETTASELGITLLWLTTHEGSEACAFYEALGYAKMGVMPAYSRRPDGSLSPGRSTTKNWAKMCPLGGVAQLVRAAES